MHTELRKESVIIQNDKNLEIFCFLATGKPGKSIQSTRVWTGVPGAHLPAHREDRAVTGAQPQTTERDLWPAEGRQSDQD